MVMLVIAVVGWIAYQRMPVDAFPDVSMPIVAVRTIYAGASPQEVESSVTKKIEEAVSSLNYVDSVRSTSRESVSLVIIEFSVDYSPKSAADDVRQRLDNIQSVLPSDAERPEVLRFDPASVPILTFAVSDDSGSMSTEQVRELVDDKIVPRIQRVPGVGTLSVVGGLSREVHVDLNLDRMRALGVAPQSVAAALQSENLDVPGGRLVESGQERLLRTAGRYQSIEDIGKVPVTNVRGSVVYLRDLATIGFGREDRRTLSRVDGLDAVTVSVLKQSGGNTVRTAESVRQELKAIESSYPGLKITVGIDQSVFTRETTIDVLVSILLGAALAAIIVLFFFRDIRNTLVTVAGLPIIVLGTFIAMSAAGYSINMISLLALSISIGVLIDDAIVVRENIFRHMEHGEEPRIAASRGTAEIALAVLATTLTIIAVFAPVGFTGGIAGKFLREFGLTVVFAVAISLFEAFTFAPMLSAHFFKRMEVGSASGAAYSRVEAAYRRLLDWSLRRWPVIIGGGAASLVAAALLLPLLSQSLLSDFDRGELGINIELPAGATIEQTDAVTRQVEAVLLQQPETAHVFTTVGGRLDTTSSELAYLSIKLRGKNQLEGYQRRIRPFLDGLTGVRYDIDRSANTFAGMMFPTSGSARSRPFSISVQGSDLAVLDVVSKQVMTNLERIPGVVDVDRTLRPGSPELRVYVDRSKAADLGISTGQVGLTLRMLVNGQVVGQFQEGDKDRDIVLRLREEDRQRGDDIAQLPIVSARGALVTLSGVATINSGVGPAAIERRDRQREVLVGGGYEGRQLGEVTNDARAMLARMDLPQDVTVKIVGQTKYMDEVFANLIFALLLAVVFIYVVLASQFESFVHPFTIGLALPLSFVGALAALVATGKSLDIIALIGIILLMGLVTKNAILLVDFTNRLKADGRTTHEALLAAGPIRLRPILMTTLAMIFGMLPVALGYGAGSEVRSPMGIVVIGGLVTSTLLTLVVVPVVYARVDAVQAWAIGRISRPGGPSGPASSSRGEDAEPIHGGGVPDHPVGRARG